MRPHHVTSFLDDQLIQQAILKPAEPIYINGETHVAKTRGSDVTVPVSTNNSATQVKVPWVYVDIKCDDNSSLDRVLDPFREDFSRCKCVIEI